MQSKYQQDVDFLISLGNLIENKKRSNNPAQVKHFLKLLGNPHKNIKLIHVVGTSGKGSTSSALHNILTANKNKCGLLTSPHLSSIYERI